MRRINFNPIFLTKFEGCMQLEFETQFDSPKRRTIQFYLNRKWTYTARLEKSNWIGSNIAITTIKILQQEELNQIFKARKQKSLEIEKTPTNYKIKFSTKFANNSLKFAFI